MSVCRIKPKLYKPLQIDCHEVNRGAATKQPSQWCHLVVARRTALKTAAAVSSYSKLLSEHGNEDQVPIGGETSRYKINPKL